MTRFLLTITKQNADAAEGYDEVFLWTQSERDSFSGVLDPHLTSLGPARQENVDFVRLALAVFAADRSVPRAGGGADWNARDLDLTVEVGNVAAWTAARDHLTRVVGFLTGDRWGFTFIDAEPNRVKVLPLDEPLSAMTVLLSGGADSASGALLSALDLKEGTRQLLVSHFSSTAVSPIQKNLVEWINKLAPRQMSLHRQANLNRASRRLDGTTFRSEPSSRSRSLLFLALGLASAERLVRRS